MIAKSSEPDNISQLLDPACPKDKQVFFVTYGSGKNLANCYSTLYATDIEEARRLVFHVTGGKHAFLYEPRFWIEDDGRTQAEHYNLRLVPLQAQKSINPFNRPYL